MDFLIGIMKDFVSRFFTMFPFYRLTPEIIEVTFGFLMFSGSIKGQHWEKNNSSFLTHFSSVFLFCTPCKRQKTLGLLLFPGGIKSEHWEEMDKIISYYMLIFIQFKGELYSNSWNLTFINKLQFPLILECFVPKVSKNW